MGLQIGRNKSGVKKPTFSLNQTELAKRILEKAKSDTSCDPHGNVHVFARLKSGKYTTSDLVRPASDESAHEEADAMDVAYSADGCVAATGANYEADYTSSQSSIADVLYAGGSHEEYTPAVQCAEAGEDSQFVEAFESAAATTEAPAPARAPGKATRDVMLRSLFSEDSEAAPAAKPKTRESKKSKTMDVPKPGEAPAVSTSGTGVASGANVVKTKRGTIELVVQASGRTLKPEYSVVGVMQSVVTSDGITFKRASDGKTWSMLDAAGKVINEAPLTFVAFDGHGNLYFLSADGTKTVWSLDGSQVTEPTK
ncbi:MAG TPA: hypothetical protein V6D17_01465 [Candidatus Obscuribacterales bacterium]